MLFVSYLILVELGKCFEIFLFVYRVKNNKHDHNATQIFFLLANTKPSPTALFFLVGKTKYVKFTFYSG